MELSKIISEVSSSKTMSLELKAQAMIEKKIDVISLVAGEPGFKTPKDVCDIAIDAILDRFTGYTQVDGIVDLKRAVISRYKRDYNLEFNLDEVLISSGAKYCLYNILMCLINPGDEVIFSSPYWVSYPEIVKLCRGVVKIIDSSCKEKLLLKADDLESAITTKTKVFIICNPSNPSGMLYSEKDLMLIANVMRRYPKLIMVCDEIYDLLSWENLQKHFLQIAPDLYDRIVIVNGVSKSYSMAGWRIGYIIANKLLCRALKKFQSQTLSGPCSISQKAAIKALQLTHADLRYYVNRYRENVLFMYNTLTNICGIKCLRPSASFYLFPNIEVLINKLHFKSDIDFCESLLKDELVAIMPGSAFGKNGYIRISCASNLKNIKVGAQRLKSFIEKRKALYL